MKITGGNRFQNYTVRSLEAKSQDMLLVLYTCR